MEINKITADPIIYCYRCLLDFFSRVSHKKTNKTITFTVKDWKPTESYIVGLPNHINKQ